MKTPQPHSCGCHCGCVHPSRLSLAPTGWNRRDFLAGLSVAAVGSLTVGLAESRPALVGSAHRPPVRKPLRVQPVLTYDLPRRREATSWRNWGGVQTEPDAQAERARIEKELKALSARAEFPLELRPVRTVKTTDEARTLAAADHDCLLLYAAGGGVQTLEALTDPKKFTLMFLRHQSGPVYLWYEIAHNRYLRKTVDEFGQPGVDVQDVVVDDPGELLWRLRALSGLHHTLGKRIVAIGGASGWGEGGRKAPQISQDTWKLNIVDVPYSQLGPRIKEARARTALVKRCEEQATAYLRQRGVRLETSRGFVERAFVLTEVLRGLLDEHGTDAITVNHCMGTIMPLSETTACLPLSLLNDDGYLAFCESDFVVIPSGILLHYVSGKPVFLNDPTYPYKDRVTLAHCTAPRKMDGRKVEPVRLLTHFESDYGAAPKVEMKIGQVVTNLIPDFANRRWVGFAGTILANPFLDICRSQIDVRIHGDTGTLLQEMQGFHWMTCYGDYLQETGYALRKVGVDWLNVSAARST